MTSQENILVGNFLKFNFLCNGVLGWTESLEEKMKCECITEVKGVLHLVQNFFQSQSTF